jgi:hypothetical protein
MGTITTSARMSRPVGRAFRRERIVTDVLLACGILSSLVYVAANVAGAMQWDGYSLLSQTVSELAAIGAPSRAIAVALELPYALLAIAFGYGIWRHAGERRGLRTAGGVFVGYGVVCLAGPFTPMHGREYLAANGRTLTDTLHIASTVVDVLLILLIIAFAADAFGARFRRYSIATVATLLIVGASTSRSAPAIEANLPTPWAGLMERMVIGAFLVWVVVLAVILLRERPAGAFTERV